MRRRSKEIELRSMCFKNGGSESGEADRMRRVRSTSISFVGSEYEAADTAEFSHESFATRRL